MTDSIANKEKIKLIASNMYLNNMTQTEKDETLSKIFADLINRTSTAVSYTHLHQKQILHLMIKQ